MTEPTEQLAQLQISQPEISQPESKESKADVLIRLCSQGKQLPSLIEKSLRKLVEENDERILRELEVTTADADIKSFDDRTRERIFWAAVERYDKLWNQLFAECSTSQAKDISARGQKEAAHLKTMSLVYGEVLYASLAVVVSKYFDMKPGGVFYDVGSGSGRGVFAAALMHDFDKLVGIEILGSLVEASNQVKSKWQSESFQEQLKAEGVKTDGQVSFVLEDFRNMNWSDADFVFANSTCFDETLMKHLSQHSEFMKEGSYFITFTKSLNSPCWKMLESKQYQMSWGLATVHVHLKTTPPRLRRAESAPSSN